MTKKSSYQTDTSKTGYVNSQIMNHQEFNLLFTLKTNKLNSDITSNYWIASRYYRYKSSSDYGLDSRIIDFSGMISNNTLYKYNEGVKTQNYNIGASLRPIIVLKSGLKYTGKGTKEIL